MRHTVNLADIPIGIEHEFFVLDLHTGMAPSAAQTRDLFSQLVKQGCTESEGRLTCPSSTGPVGIGHDYGTHIIELSFPPCSDDRNLQEMLERVTQLVLGCVWNAGLTHVPGAVLDQSIGEVTQVSNPRIGLMSQRMIPKNGRFCAIQPTAVIASTQVSLGIEKHQAYGLLPLLYRLEWLVPTLFSSSFAYRGVHGRSIRPLIWKDSFDSSYKAVGFPVCVPSSEDTYKQMIDGCFRDYSFIAVREGSRVEFRSADSQRSPEDVLALAALRLLQLGEALDGGTSIGGMNRAEYYSVCEQQLSSANPVEPVLGTIRSAVDRYVSSHPVLHHALARRLDNFGIGPLTVRVATDLPTKDLAYRLRAQVFAMEGGRTKWFDTTSGLYTDPSDNANCVLLVAEWGTELVGTLRLTLPEAGIIAEDVYDFHQVRMRLNEAGHRGPYRIAVLERGCVRQDFRGVRILNTLVREAILASERLGVHALMAAQRTGSKMGFLRRNGFGLTRKGVPYDDGKLDIFQRLTGL